MVQQPMVKKGSKYMYTSRARATPGDENLKNLKMSSSGRSLRWRLDRKALASAQKADVGVYEICPDEVVGDHVSWRLIMYPNGFCESERGNVNIFLVAKLDKDHDWVSNMKYKIVAVETKTVWRGNVAFDKDHANHRLTNKLKTEQLHALTTLTYVI